MTLDPERLERAAKAAFEEMDDRGLLKGVDADLFDEIKEAVAGVTIAAYLGGDETKLIREIEIPWLKGLIGESIAKLGYPVGCGVAPTDAHLETAAGFLFSRYEKMIALVRAGVGPLAERGKK